VTREAGPMLRAGAVQRLKIAEEGVEAAVVTLVPMGPGSAPPPPQRIHHLAFDRPFGIVVLDGAADVPLFAGWQADIPVHQA
jgi:serine protease inhibitor